MEAKRTERKTVQGTFKAAGLVPGEKYTIFHLGHDFGFPMFDKITFDSMSFEKYAQYEDAVKLTFTPYRKRRLFYRWYYNESFIICRGWHDLDETKIKNIIEDTPEYKATMTKYSCFDARYIQDAKEYLPDIIAVYDEYKTGKNGKLYA